MGLTYDGKLLMLEFVMKSTKLPLWQISLKYFHKKQTYKRNVLIATKYYLLSLSVSLSKSKVFGFIFRITQQLKKKQVGAAECIFGCTATWILLTSLMCVAVDNNDAARVHGNLIKISLKICKRLIIKWFEKCYHEIENYSNYILNCENKPITRHFSIL